MLPSSHGVAFETGGARFQFTRSYAWIPAFGVSFAVGVDGIALVMLLLIGVLVPVVILASWHDVTARRRAAAGAASMHGLLRAAAGARGMMIGVFAATDVFLFYVFFEAMLIPMYFLIGSYGGPRRQYAAVKFFLYSLVGGLLMLAAVIGLYVVSAPARARHLRLRRRCASSTSSTRHAEAGCSSASSSPSRSRRRCSRSTPGCPTPVPRRRSGGAVLLVGVLDKVGTFGFLRYCLPLFPDASR